MDANEKDLLKRKSMLLERELSLTEGNIYRMGQVGILKDEDIKNLQVGIYCSCYMLCHEISINIL